MEQSETKQAIKVLEAAKTHLTNHEWTRGNNALDAKGQYVSPRSKKAVKFCAVGSFMAVSKSDKAILFAKELFTSAHPMHDHVTEFNDSHAKDKRDVIRAFDKTIKYGNKQLS